MSYFVRAPHLAWLLLLVAGCSKSGESPKSPVKGNGQTGLPFVPGTPDTSVETALPPLPRLLNVTASARGDSVALTVEPVEGARDYRVYVLPDDDAISATDDGHVTITDAVYRCAGDRQSPTVAVDGMRPRQSESFRTLVDGEEVLGYTRSLDEATLGYVYVTPGSGRIPVYAMGEATPSSDNLCYWQRWTASRVKRYVTSEAERAELLSQRWRDDGVVFYIPAPGEDGTIPVYTAMGTGEAPLYFVAGPEAEQRRQRTTAFNVLAEPALPDTVPLMRVHYENACGRSHDELAAGVPRFERARYQGDQLPLFDLHWSGITGETTLVVEALDVGCPFQGILTAASRQAGREDGVDYPPFLTLDDVRAASETGEIFINGQHDGGNRPRPIARSFVRISPGPKPDMDWFAGFGSNERIPDFMALGFDEPCNNPTNPTCEGESRQVSEFADFSFYGATVNRITAGAVMGELWVTYADVGADVGGKMRLTPTTKGRISADAYLHVTMEVDAFTTARRYPQILISDAEAPIQGRIASASTVIIQPFPDETPNWPNLLQVQVCDRHPWEVNDQCPSKDLWRDYSPGSNDPFQLDGLNPVAEVGEYTGVDRSTHIDAFVSLNRAYVFLDGQPYGCVDLPSRGVPNGEVTVTFGDVLYHSGVDEVFAFHKNHQLVVARRHFDNLGFKSGVEGPAWDEARLPCVNIVP